MIIEEVHYFRTGQSFLNIMANIEEQMRLFEAEVGQQPPQTSRPPPFMPPSVRGGPRVPPPPSYPPRHQPLVKSYAPPVKEYSAPAVISKPPETDDTDVFSTLLKYEKEVRQEKRDKKKDAKLGNNLKPQKPEKPVNKYSSSASTIAAPPVRPGSSGGSGMVPSSLMKPSHISASPTVTPVVKPGTQVFCNTFSTFRAPLYRFIKSFSKNFFTY